MTNLLTWRFWFALRPESLTPLSQKIFIALIIVFAAAAFLMLLAKRRSTIYRGLYKRLYSFFVSNIIIGAVLFFFDYEMVPFFAARFWLGLWALTMIIWLIFIIKQLKTIPLQRRQQAKEEELKKYLP